VTARQGRFPQEEVVKVSINIQLVRIELVISVDQEPHPVIQIVQTAMSVVVEKIINITATVLCV
jgi:hypothetical protein